MNKKNLNLIIMTVVYPGATNHVKKFVNSIKTLNEQKFYNGLDRKEEDEV